MRSNLIFFLATVLSCSIYYTQAADEFYDFRCICICPSFTVINQTETNRKIYIEVIPKDRCSCENVLSRWKPNQSEMLKQFCPRCNCNFEIVVIIIICILALLFIYMGFLLCLDPWMNRRTRLYQEQQNEELSLESDDQPFAQLSNSSSRSNVINRVSKEQSKWKRQVQEQRRTVYDRHVLLN